MKNKKLVIITLTIIVLLIAAGFGTLLVLTHVDESSICENVYIDTLDVGKMTREEATSALEAYIDQLKQTKVTVNVGEEEVSSTLGEIGLTVDEQNCIDEAMNAGKEGSLLKKYRELRKIKSKSLVLHLHSTFEESRMDAFLAECKKYDIDPQNSVLTREDGVFKATESVDGVVLDEAKTKALLEQALNNWNHKDVIVVDADVEATAADITREQALLCDTVLGSYSTYYGSSSYNRRTNVENGASKINGTVLYPGEEFSAATTMGPFEESNGYALAGAYSSGKTIESFGGGVCQVSTTLYNALLLAELDITERYNHSMIVSYVKPAMDAAISGTSKDLKFVNNTDAPIYIQSYTSGGSLYFTVWGHEMRDANRTIEYVSDVVETIQPGEDVITEDPTQSSDYKKVESSAHIGYKAYLYKVVYVDGVEQSREQINYSSYAASPNYITVGKVVEEPEETEEPKATEAAESEEEAEEPEKTEKPEATEKPQKTEKPTATEKPQKTEAPQKTEKPASTPKPTEKPQKTEAPASEDEAE